MQSKRTCFPSARSHNGSGWKACSIGQASKPLIPNRCVRFKRVCIAQLVDLDEYLLIHIQLKLFNVRSVLFDLELVSAVYLVYKIALLQWLAWAFTSVLVHVLTSLIFKNNVHEQKTIRVILNSDWLLCSHPRYRTVFFWAREVTSFAMKETTVSAQKKPQTFLFLSLHSVFCELFQFMLRKNGLKKRKYLFAREKY